MAEEAGEEVQLYVYDLSQGLARQLSPMLLGKQLDGIWHTALVVGGVEYYYGGGVQMATPGRTPFGQPVQVIDLGTTFVPADVREEFLVELSQKFTPEAYSLLHNNCNNFSDELATLLTGSGIPPHITGLPADVLATPFGQMMLPALQNMEAQLGSVRQHQSAMHPPFSTPGASSSGAASGSWPAPAQPQRLHSGTDSRVGAPVRNVPVEGEEAEGPTSIYPGPLEMRPAHADGRRDLESLPRCLTDTSRADAAVPGEWLGGAPDAEVAEVSASLAEAVEQTAALQLAEQTTATPEGTAEAGGSSTAPASTEVAQAALEQSVEERKAAFVAAIHAEHARLLASGLSATEAAVEAVQRLRARGVTVRG